MNKKLILKMIIDFFMMVIMILEMGVRVTGTNVHKYLGISLFALFIIHNVLNIRWYKTIAKGKMTAQKFLRCAVNLLVLLNMIILMLSSIFIADFIRGYVSNSVIFAARDIHMIAAYWLFALISVHLGMHYNMILNIIIRKVKFNESKKGSIIIKTVIKYVMRILAVLIFIYGAKSFLDRDIAMKMMGHYTNSHWSMESSKFRVFADYLSIMGSFVFVIYYAIKYGRNILNDHKH